MIENTLFGVVLENPKHRMLHVSEALRQAKHALIEMGLLKEDGSLTNEGTVAQKLIKEASPRRASYRQEESMWLRMHRQTHWRIDSAKVHALTKTALENLLAAQLIEVDSRYSQGVAYRWRA